MTSLRLTLETRRAAFRAQVVATACGEGEVSTHIDSLHPLPLSEDMKRVFARLPATRAATPTDLLLAVLLSDEGLAGELAARGLTADVLRR